MGVFETLTDIAKTAITTDLQLKQLREELDEANAKVRRLGEDVVDLRERVVRLEAQRDADRAQLAAQIEVFKTVMERGANRSRALPDCE